jgi:membrane protein DedA with SNARE-associated domain
MDYSSSQFLNDYGYLALFVGSLLEGETFLLLAGFAAHRGYLSYPMVVLVGFTGGTLGDLISFTVGRRWGPGILERFPRMTRRVEQVNGLVERYHSVVIVMVRFMYGLRVAGPVVIGMSGVRVGRFAVFNALGAALWAVLVSGAGYWSGNAVDALFKDFSLYEHWVLAVAGVGAVGVMAYRWARRLKRGAA